MKTTILVTILFLGSLVNAAPIPGATSSQVNPQLGLYISPLGFQIASGESKWLQSSPPKDSNFMVTMFKSSASPQAAALTVRIDKIDSTTKNIQAYMKKWLKEYPKFGFEVLGTKAVSQNGTNGMLVDLVNRESEKKLRQVIFLKNQNAVILTCRDHQVTFNKALPGCNQIIRTFKWN